LAGPTTMATTKKPTALAQTGSATKNS